MASNVLDGRELLIFDLDGTIADTGPVHAAAFTAAFAPWGIAVDYPPLAGLTTEQAVDRVLAAHGHDGSAAQRADLVADKRRHARTRIAAGVVMLPGAATFIAAARAGRRLAMYSSGSRGTVAATLAAIGLDGTFDPLVTGDDVAAGKPAPDGYAAILAATGIPAAATVVFEDSAAGIAAAEAAGIDAVRIGAGGTQWHDLLGLLR